jgi:hypothetical protein
MKIPCSKLYLTGAIKTQKRAQQNDASVTLDSVTLTVSLDQVFTERMINDLQFVGGPTVSADKTFSEPPCTSNKPAQRTLSRYIMCSTTFGRKPRRKVIT